MNTKIHCNVCNRVLGVRKGDLLEFKCPKCRSTHLYNIRTGVLVTDKS